MTARASAATGHWGGELRVPVTSFLQVSGAGRYDHFKFAGSGIGKFTYNAGLELRPMSTLLMRAAYGTGFRAPDLHYVFTGPGNTHPSATDYYLCRVEEPDEDIGDCSYADSGIVAQRNGNKGLKPETSKSFNAGFVWQPSRRFDVSVDYFRVSLANQVQDLNIDTLLRDEADCRIGQTENGTAGQHQFPHLSGCHSPRSSLCQRCQLRGTGLSLDQSNQHRAGKDERDRHCPPRQSANRRR